jgi:DNA-binding GntR family transcriptional regulator
MSRTPVREALIILSTSNMVVMKPQTGTFVSPIDVHRMDTEQFARYALEKEIITRACGHITEEHRWLYEENLRTYRHYAELPSENRGKNLLRLDNEFHRIAFLAVGREENYRIQFGQLQHIERMRMLSLHFMGQETNVKDHTGLYQAIADGDLKTTLERLEVHMGRYRENLAAVQERYPNYFSMS